jgi:hypothetical protein
MHALWLPIALSAVAVFVLSSLIHMALTAWHASDYGTVPNQDAVMDALRPFAIPPGDYNLPHCDSMAEMKGAAFQDKLKRGPVAIMTVLPNGMMGMGRSLALWFVYLLVVVTLSAYVASRTQPVGAAYLSVFRIIAVPAFLGFAGALWQGHIWYRRSGSTTLKSTIDGLIFALVTAGIFGWLWPR